jgi:YegS/Rv2252/BmrU family lipid kinase
MSPSVAIILNPHARQAEECIAKVREKTGENGIPVTFFHVLQKDDAMESVIDKALEQKPDVLVVGGGDGTVRTAAECLLGTDMPLLVLPLGTTNNIARSLDLPLDWKEALELGTSGTIEDAYVGNVNGRIFCNAATLGISSRIADEVTSEEKKVLGRLAYAWKGMKLFAKESAFRCTIKSPKHSVTCRTYQVVVSNGGFHAGRVISDTSIEKRQLSLTIFGKYQRASTLKSFLSFLFGRHQENPDTILKEDTTFEITVYPPQDIELDGEILTKTPAVFTLAPKKLRVIVPKSKA